MTNINSAMPIMPPVVSSAEELGARSVNNKAKAASDVKAAWEEDVAVNLTISNQSRGLNEVANLNREALESANRLSPTAFAFGWTTAIEQA